VIATIELGLDERLQANEQLLSARLLELTEENARLRRALEPGVVHEAVIVDEGTA
jgi:hypothetical protein